MARRLLFLSLLAAATACSSSNKSTCDPSSPSSCSGGQVCEAIQNGTSGCFAPVLVRGTVADLSSSSLLGDARVVALDPSRAPLSTVAVTAGDGAYELKLAHVARSDGTGKPAQGYITLRADKQGYATFPGGLRTALPVDLSGATSVSGSWVVSGTLTALELMPLTNGGAAFIHGSVAATPAGAGALVVAEPVGGGTGVTGVPDVDGNYAIYNLTPGMQYVVTAYTRGTNYVPVTSDTLATGDNAVSAITRGAGSGATFSGGLIFNNAPNTNIQVSLVVESTYDSILDRGESPPGLTVAGNTGGYTFTGVPDGNYVVLAPVGLSGDVRDISGTGNTAAPQVTIMNGAIVGDPPGFKIIPAVNLLTIDGVAVSATPATVTSATPVFTWKRGSVDASASTYRVLVYDAFGNEQWSSDMAATSDDATTYSGSALDPGMTYQLRILAIKEAMPILGSFTQLSQTEDVAGVFTYQP